MTPLPAPVGLLAELTHRCPLGCPYCSNPLELTKASQELDTKTWINVFNEAADLGVAHVHLSGGEPLVRPDLAELTNAAHLAGLYTNLLTSAVGLSVRGTGGEHTPIGADGTVDISPSNRLFISEAEIVAKLYNGVKLLLEKEIEAGASKPKHHVEQKEETKVKSGP